MIEKWIQLDKRRNQTLSKQLELSLYSVIMTKSLPSHYKLPSPDELAESLLIDSLDVQLAYDALIKSNIIEFINGHYSIKMNIVPTANNYVLKALVESIKSIGLEPAIVPIDQVKYPMQSLKRLQNEFDQDDTVLSVKRIYTGNNHPIAYLDEYLSLKYFPDLDKLDLSQFQFYPYIFETYPDSYTITREFTIESMPKEIALQLNQNEGIPATHTISRAFNSSGHVVEYADIWAVADYFKFNVEVDI